MGRHDHHSNMANENIIINNPGEPFGDTPNTMDDKERHAERIETYLGQRSNLKR